MDTFLSILIGLGLPPLAASGSSSPLLVIPGSRAAVATGLGDGFAWLGSTPALITFSAATLLEIAGYYIPWVDNLLDTLATPTAVDRRYPGVGLGAGGRQPVPALDPGLGGRRRHRGRLPGDDVGRPAGLLLHHRRARQSAGRHRRGGGSALLSVLAVTLPVSPFLLVCAALFGVEKAALPTAARRHGADRGNAMRPTETSSAPRPGLSRSPWSSPGAASAGPKMVSRLTRELRSAGPIPTSWSSRSRSTDEMRAWVHARVPDHRPGAAAGPAPRRDRRPSAKDFSSVRSRATGTARRGLRQPRATASAFTSLFVGLARELGHAGLLPRRGGRRAVREGRRPGGGLRARQRRLRPGRRQHQDPRLHRRPEEPTTATRRRLRPDGDRPLLLEPRRRAAAGRQGEGGPGLAAHRRGARSRAAARLDQSGGGARRAGDLAGAEAAYRRALEVDPGAPRPTRTWRPCCASAGRTREAERLLRSGLTEAGATRSAISRWAT